MTGKEYNSQFSIADINMEKWVDIVGFEGSYQISSIGRIKCLTRKVYYNNKGKQKTLTINGCIKIPALNKRHKRMFTALYLEGKVIQKYIHQLVLENFVGPCPKGMQACHNDGNAYNNRVENLRWDTCKNNHADKIKHGTTSLGEKNTQHKLKYNDVINIRLLRNIISVREISKIYNISKTHVHRVVNFKDRVFA